LATAKLAVLGVAIAESAVDASVAVSLNRTPRLTLNSTGIVPGPDGSPRRSVRVTRKENTAMVLTLAHGVLLIALGFVMIVEAITTRLR
jgi:hypothetical protein